MDRRDADQNGRWFRRALWVLAILTLGGLAWAQNPSTDDFVRELVIEAADELSGSDDAPEVKQLALFINAFAGDSLSESLAPFVKRLDLLVVSLYSLEHQDLGIHAKAIGVFDNVFFGSLDLGKLAILGILR